jgi:long-chain acyl-CoA synthetase
MQSTKIYKPITLFLMIDTYPLYKIIDDAARDFPDANGFDFLGKKFKWRELGAAVNAFARGLQDAEVKQGTKIGLCLPNCPQYLVAYYGALKAGMTVVNYNPLYAKDELEYQINDSETEIMVTLDLKVTYDKVGEMLSRTKTLKHIIVCRFVDVLPFPKNLLFPVFKSKDIATWPRDESHFDLDDVMNFEGLPKAVEIDVKNDVALLQYTGGTTGVPKGAMLTHANLSANTEQCLVAFDGVEMGKEKMLAVIPFFHVFAMTVALNLATRIASEIIAIPKFELEDAIKLIHKKKPTVMPAVAAIYNAIANYKDIAKYDLTSLKRCISGGAPLPVEVKRKFEKMTGCILVEGYGLTETSPVTHVNPLDGENKPGSIGLPLEGTQVQIVDPEKHKKQMKQGEKGEICIKGPQVMKGYWNNAESTKNTLRDGEWLHTGDIAYVDDDGYFFIVDRIKDLIITNGYNVYPRHVEEALYKHKDVEECIVGGLPCDQRGERVKAWIKLKDDRKLSEIVLREFLKDKISPIEMPKDIEFRTEPLPKTMIGKLSRKDIIAEEGN